MDERHVEEYGYTPAVPSHAAAAAASGTADAATDTAEDDDDEDRDGEVAFEETEDEFDDFDDDDDEDVFMDVAIYERVMGRAIEFPPPPPPLDNLNSGPVERVQLESSSSF